MVRTAVVLALFALGISTSDSALACMEDWGGIHCPRGGPVVDVTDDQPPQCDVRCDDGGEIPTPRLECLRQGKHDDIYFCEVWPRARGMIYTWKNLGGSLAFEDETESTAQEIRCNSRDTRIRIELRATAPSQATKVASFRFSCGSDPILYLQGREIISTR